MFSEGIGRFPVCFDVELLGVVQVFVICCEILSAHKRRAPRRARHGRHGKRASIEVLATRRCGGALDGEKELKYCVECKTL
jgi:hypothetical protein